MLTTGGTPATLLFGNAQIHPLFAVALALIVWPKGYTTRDVRSPMKQSTSDTSKHKWILLSCLLAYFLVQVGIPHFWAISGLDIILILLIGPKTVTTPWRKELYLLAIATLLAVAVSTGATHQFQLACNALVNMFGGFGAGGVALLAGLFSSLGGEGAASLVLAQSFQEVSYGPSTVLQQAAVMGLAIGGLGPLIAARAFRSSLRLFAFQFVLMVVLVLTFGV
jgi:hypothetical protein